MIVEMMMKTENEGDLISGRRESFEAINSWSATAAAYLRS